MNITAIKDYIEMLIMYYSKIKKTLLNMFCAYISVTGGHIDPQSSGEYICLFGGRYDG